MTNSLTLHPKVVGATGGGSIGILTVWILGLAHVTVDPTVAAALAAVVAGFCAWLSPLIQHEVTKAEGKS